MKNLFTIILILYAFGVSSCNKRCDRTRLDEISNQPHSEKLVNELKQFTEEYPSCNEGIYRLTIAYSDFGNSDSEIVNFSIDYLTKAINLGLEDCDKLIECYYKRGLLKSDRGEYSSSIQDFTSVIEQSDNCEDKHYFEIALFSRAFDHQKNMEYQRAIEDYTILIELKSEFMASAYGNRGIIYFNLNDYRRAEADFSKEIKLDSSNAYIYYYRGVCRINTGNIESGCIDLNKATKQGIEIADSIMSKSCLSHN